MNRQEDARQHRIAYNERSIELFDEFGIQLGTCDSYDIEGDVQEEIEKRKRVKEALSHLSEKQLRRLKLYADGKTYREIASIENTTPSVIFELYIQLSNFEGLKKSPFTIQRKIAILFGCFSKKIKAIKTVCRWKDLS